MDPYSSGQFNQYQQMPPMQPPKTNGKAIAALVLGILSITSFIIFYIAFILGVIAIVLASLSFKEIKRRQEGGHGLAMGGLVCGIIGTAISSIFILILILVFVFSVGTVDDYYDVLSSIPPLQIA